MNIEPVPAIIPNIYHSNKEKIFINDKIVTAIDNQHDRIF